VGYNCQCATGSDCVPGQWLIYTLLLALPFPAKVVRPDSASPGWLCPPKRKRHGVVPDRNLRGMPDDVPQLPDAQYSLPEAVGRLFDCTILSGDALRTPADMWCRLAMGNLLRAGAVVRPMRAAVDRRLGVATGVAAAVPDVDDAASNSGVKQRVSARLRLRTVTLRSHRAAVPLWCACITGAASPLFFLPTWFFHMFGWGVGAVMPAVYCEMSVPGSAANCSALRAPAVALGGCYCCAGH
jgi:hypothetical protein